MNGYASGGCDAARANRRSRRINLADHRRFETRWAFSVNWRPAGTARQGRFNPDGIQVRPYRDQARIYIIITSDGGRPGFAAPLPQMTNQIIPRGTGLAGCRRLPPRVLRWQRSIQGITASLLALAMLSVAHAQKPAPAAVTSRPVRLLVKPKGKPAASPSSVIGGSKVKRVFPRLGDLEVVELPAGVAAQTALAILKQSKDVEYAEADQIVRLQGTEPNDYRYQGGELWNLHNTGQLGGTPGADIKAPEAWDIRHDAPTIIVALVDSGLRQTHEDLAPNLWRNPREIPGNGIDDDGNGIIDDVHGFNAWADNGNPEDDLGHGTHVAGIIGAAGNNTVGVVGVAWKVQLMSTKFTDPQGNGTVSDAIACIDYARQMGAQVINASWGAPDLFNSTALRDAIAAARDAGIIFVTVAGNNSADNDATLYYPGAFDLDNIVVVTATDRNDQLAFFANYGAKTVDLGAPGYNIFSCWFGSDSDYQYYNGGSMAVAHVSGAAALLRAHFPGDTPQATIKRIL